MVAHSGLTTRERLDQIAGAQLRFWGVGDQAQQSQACRISDDLERGCKIQSILLAQWHREYRFTTGLDQLDIHAAIIPSCGRYIDKRQYDS